MYVEALPYMYTHLGLLSIPDDIILFLFIYLFLIN